MPHTPQLPDEPTTEDLHLARALSRAAADRHTNGEAAHARAQHRPRFDGTVNLGHILTMIAMGSALLTMWTNQRVSQADHEFRIRALEGANAEFKVTLAKMAENESVALRNQEQLRMTMEWVMKTVDAKPRGQ